MRPKLTVDQSRDQASSSNTRVLGDNDMLPILPLDVKIEIALRMTHPSAILMSGTEGRDILLNSSFRSRFDLRKYFHNTRLMYRDLGFFFDCFVDSNPQAICLLGLETLCMNGDIYPAWSYFEEASRLGDKMSIVMSLLIFICTGTYDIGITRFQNRLPNWRDEFLNLRHLVRMMEQTIVQFLHGNCGRFKDSWYCPQPDCGLEHEEWDCPSCFFYQHSKIIKHLCYSVVM